MAVIFERFAFVSRSIAGVTRVSVEWLIHSISRHGLVLKSREIPEEAVSLLKIRAVPRTRAGQSLSYQFTDACTVTEANREILSAIS